IGFDAVAGEMSERVAKAQPRGSRLIVYGALSLAPVQADPESLIFEGKRIEGFWLSAWLRDKNPLNRLFLMRQIQSKLKDVLRSEVQGRFPLEQTAQALRQYSTHMSSGKALIVP